MSAAERKQKALNAYIAVQVERMRKTNGKSKKEAR